MGEGKRESFQVQKERREGEKVDRSEEIQKDREKTAVHCGPSDTVVSIL